MKVSLIAMVASIIAMIVFLIAKKVSFIAIIVSFISKIDSIIDIIVLKQRICPEFKVIDVNSTKSSDFVAKKSLKRFYIVFEKKFEL
jgi:hypothetical protein